MRIPMSIGLIAVVSLLTTACPLASDFPLSPPEAAILDPGLNGVWTAVNEENGEATEIVFRPFNEREYAALVPGDEEGDFDMYRVFTTEIGGERFLNVRELSGKDEPWYLLRYRNVLGRLELSIVDEALFESRAFPSSEALSDFVREKLGNPLLYGDAGGKVPDMVLKRR